MRQWVRRVGACAVVATASLACAGAAVAAPAPGFEDEHIFSPVGPTGIAFTPDGRMLVTEQQGRVRVVGPDGAWSTTALDYRSKVCNNRERGMDGITVDPGFALNGYFYVYYTYKRIDCPEDGNSLTWPVNRVSRFTLGTNNQVISGSEVVLIDGIPNKSGIHNAGDLHVGNDGNLWVTVGDGGCDYNGPGCGDTNDAARDRNVLLGKVLRITRDGNIPADNPYGGASAVRCNTGPAAAGKLCREIYATGLRNPFRFAFDPDATGIRALVNDVGSRTWEEIDDLRAGADYGWNVREGHCANSSRTNCTPVSGYTDPLYDYDHDSGCMAITGGAFVPRSSAWGTPWEGSYLFADYVCGKIFRLVPKMGGGYTTEDFATGAGSPVHLEFGPAGSSTALYYTTYTGGGEVRRIVKTGATNRRPAASLTADKTFGPTPLDVRFDASGSSDPDGDALTYTFDFGDGSPAVTQDSAIATHAYARDGDFRATVVAQDAGGATSDPAAVDIHPGNRAPVAAITGVSADYRYGVGDNVALHADVSDPDDPDTPPSVEWTAVVHHNQHTHPFLAPTADREVTLRMPSPEDMQSMQTSWVEVTLEATDADGVSATATLELRPKLVGVSFDSSPHGVAMTANGNAFTTPGVFWSVPGYQIHIVAPAKKGLAPFKRWNDGNTSPDRWVTTPPSGWNWVATYSFP